MKKILFFSFLISISSCKPPSFEELGGTRITLEVSVGELLKKYLEPGDSLAYAIIATTYKELANANDSFLDLYFKKLQVADPASPAGKHFNSPDLAPAANFTICKTFFEKELKTGMDKTLLVLAKRIDGFGILNPNIRIGKNATQIIVELPGEVEAERVRKLLQSTARLEFWETYKNAAIYEKLMKINTVLGDETATQNPDSIVKAPEKIEGTLDEQFAAQKSDKEINEELKKGMSKRHPLFAFLMPAYSYDNGGTTPSGLQGGPVVGVALATDTSRVNAVLNTPEAKRILGAFTKFLWTVNPVSENQPAYQLVAIKIGHKGNGCLSGDIIKSAKVVMDDVSGRRDVSITMTQIAGFDWQKMTKDNIGNEIAIVLDDKVYSYPNVIAEIPSGISSISGAFTEQEARDFANVLNAGYLPLPLHIVAEELVEPSVK